MATYPLGAVGYALGPEVRVVDLWGLADPFTGHRQLDFRYIPGHEKSTSGPWLVARLARDPSLYPLMSSMGSVGRSIRRTRGLDHLEQVAWAEAALNAHESRRSSPAMTNR